MTKPIWTIVAVLVCICSSHVVASFSLEKLKAPRTQEPNTQNQKSILLPPAANNEAMMSPLVSIIQQQDTITRSSVKVYDNNSLKQSLLAGCITFLTTTPMSAFAESADDLEIVDLPPVYVPILFAIGVLGGVGVLTASLGNVMDEGELVSVVQLDVYYDSYPVRLLNCSYYDILYISTEASLGLQSGARAKKERDRSRSSYFKK